MMGYCFDPKAKEVGIDCNRLLLMSFLNEYPWVYYVSEDIYLNQFKNHTQLQMALWLKELNPVFEHNR